MFLFVPRRLSLTSKIRTKKSFNACSHVTSSDKNQSFSPLGTECEN